MLAKLPAAQRALLEAADLIEIHGHCKHIRTDEGAFCVLGAITMAATGDPWKLTTKVEACDIFAKFLGRSPAPWNNEPARTAKEVVEALRAAAFQ